MKKNKEKECHKCIKDIIIIIQAHASKERCSKCGDSQHVQGFRYPANKYQSKIATSLVISAACATRKKSVNKKGSPVSRAHQLKTGTAYM